MDVVGICQDVGWNLVSIGPFIGRFVPLSIPPNPLALDEGLSSLGADWKTQEPVTVSIGPNL